jgi:16S rRNA (adenine1518-N6/adenine1519-N6)-dimethyltransferase
LKDKRLETLEKVKAKKHLGQHFLKEVRIAERIVDLLSMHKGYKSVLEIGAGMGVLTQFLLKSDKYQTFIIEIDTESVNYLKSNFVLDSKHLIEGDFLRLDLKELFQESFAIIGNLPYNISSPIFFKVLENKDSIPEVVCMIQKEVADRIVAKHGSKTYGILSVLLQAFYDIKYAFTVSEGSFNPPPKVKSAVISLKRNEVTDLGCSENLFFQVVKAGFNQRRKMLRNPLKMFNLSSELLADDVFNKRAEQLSVADFIELTKRIEHDKMSK